MEHNSESNTKAKALENLANSMLPVELWLEIFPHLTVDPILNCLRTCKAFEYIYLPLLSAKRNYFVVGRVQRYGDVMFDEKVDTLAMVMEVNVGYGTIRELSKLCFASCALIVIQSDRYVANDSGTYWNPGYNLPRIISNVYIAMGSPNIIVCYTDVNNDKADQTAYERFKTECEKTAREVLGQNFPHFKTIPLPKKYSMRTNKMVEWYKGPTLLDLIGQTNQYLPQLTMREALVKPDYMSYYASGRPIFLTIAGVQAPPPMSHIKCPIMPHMPWIHPLRGQDSVSITPTIAASHRVITDLMHKPRPGNCLVSIAVKQNTLRNHFENEMYLLDVRRYIHIHLLFQISDGKIEFVDQVYPGENCMAVATITIDKIITYKQPEDPKVKSAYGKFVANDHASEVFYGVVLKFDKNHARDFFEGDVPEVYKRPNVLRQRRRQVIIDKEEARRARVKEQRAKRKEAKKASKEFVETARKLNLMP